MQLMRDIQTPAARMVESIDFNVALKTVRQLRDRARQPLSFSRCYASRTERFISNTHLIITTCEVVVFSDDCVCLKLLLFSLDLTRLSPSYHELKTSETLSHYPCAAVLEMHDEIFHFEIFKNFMKILKYFKTFFKIFHETFNFQY